MTTGILLRRLQLNDNLDGISHLFIDEVHERDISTDFLLIIVKVLVVKRPDIKVILMSATMNAEIFADYFRSNNCIKINIPGRAFSVDTFFLEDILEQTGFLISASSSCAYNPKKKASGILGSLKVASDEVGERKRRYYLNYIYIASVE